jgi:hypothetical protein
MWLFTKRGFFSAVADHKDPDTIWVRGRVRDDVENLAGLGRSMGLRIGAVLTSPGRDYRYRVSIPKGEWMVLLARLGLEIDYPNFKSEIRAEDPERERLYGEVWATMLALQQREGPVIPQEPEAAALAGP